MSAEQYTPDALPLIPPAAPIHLAADRLRVDAEYDEKGRVTSLSVVVNDDELNLDDIAAVVALVHGRSSKPITMPWPSVARNSDIQAERM